MENNIEVLNLLLGEIRKKPNDPIFKFMFEGWKNKLSQRIIEDYHLTNKDIRTLLNQLQNEGYIDKDFNLLKTESYHTTNISASDNTNIYKTETKREINQLPQFSSINKNPLTIKVDEKKRKTPQSLLLSLLIVIAGIIILFMILEYINSFSNNVPKH
jgi:competence protein ComGC